MPEEKFGDLKSVELELWADTQDGERNTEGTAVVHLPVRAQAGPNAVARKLLSSAPYGRM